MSLTESDMNALREMFVDVAGATAKSVTAQIGAQMGALEKSLSGKIDELSGRVDGLANDMAEVKAQVGQVLDRLTVVEADVGNMRAQLAGLARVDVQRRLDKVEARLAALEEARQ